MGERETVRRVAQECERRAERMRRVVPSFLGERMKDWIDEGSNLP